MAEFVRGEVVVVLFPFSDLTQVKKRPALVLASPSRSDVLLCQITSRKDIGDGYAVDIQDSDFAYGKLSQSCRARPNRIFTADKAIVLNRAGTLKADKMRLVTDAVISILAK